MERVARFGVHVRRASGLPDDVDSLVKVKIESHSQSTYAVEEERNPEWNQLFTFEVKKPHEAKINFKVVDSRRFRPAKTIGKSEANLNDLYKHDAKEEVPFLLYDKNNKPKGTLYVSFYHQQPSLDKPLKVLCATWNVGNAAPPKDLGLWLKGCKTGAYDLIAVGAQECQFSNKEKSTALSSILSGSLTPQLSSAPNGDSTDMDDGYGEQISLLVSSVATTPSATPTSLTPAITPVPTPTARGAASNPEAPWPEQEGGNTPNLIPSPRQEDEPQNGEADYVSPFHVTREIYDTIIASETTTVSTAEAPAGAGQAKWSAELVDSITSLQVTALESVAARLTRERGDTEGGPAVDGSPFLDGSSLDDGDRADASWDGASQPPEPAMLCPSLPPRPYNSKEDGLPTTPGGAGPEAKVKYKKSTGAILKKIGQRIYYGNGALSFEEVVTEAVGEQYVLVDRKNMGQVRLLVFARFDIRNAIEWTESKSEGTGVASVGTNKGGVGVALRVGNTNICFVSAHLAAHQSKIAEREKDYKEIVDGLDMDEYQMDVVTGYHHTIFMGDLNYRIDFRSQKTSQLDSPTQEDFDEMVTKISNKQYDELLKDDQLKTEMERAHVFVGFKEAPIKFAPTFKVLRNKLQEYDVKRSPAWCDRVLALSTLPHLQAQFEEYYSVPELVTSDHKPVAAVLSLPVVIKTLAAGKGKDPTDPGRLRYAIHIQTLTATCSLKYLADDSLLGPTMRVYSAAFDPDHAPMYEAKLRLGADPATMPSIREPLVMKLQQGPVDEMEDDRLMIRLLSSIQGGRSSIGRAVLPLCHVVAQHRAAPGEPMDFHVRLLDNGINVGDLRGKIMIKKWQPPIKPPLVHEGSRDLTRSAPYPPPSGVDPTPGIAPSHSSTLQIFASVSNENAAAVAFATRTNTLTGRAVSNSLTASMTASTTASMPTSLLGPEVPMKSVSSDGRAESPSSTSDGTASLGAEGGSESDRTSRLKRSSPYHRPLPSVLL